MVLVNISHWMQFQSQSCIYLSSQNLNRSLAKQMTRAQMKIDELWLSLSYGTKTITGERKSTNGDYCAALKYWMEYTQNLYIFCNFLWKIFSFNFGHLLIPGRNIFPITDLEIPNFEWHQELAEKKHFAVQQDFARIKGNS